MIILGTAGHIDHGKTTLIRTVTGIDTDRLKQEKERGISIELGFAYFDLPNGVRAGVIDVPGHEKFVRQMIAGAVGVDVVLLVIAADEGVMPQTREHLDICRLLGVKNGLVVVTKTDLVDEEWLLLVEEDIREFVQDTFLEDAPLLHFSSALPEVVESFKRELEAVLVEMFPEPPKRDRTRPFKMPVDRVFSMKGFGTVVTGTVQSGELRVGEEVTLLPEGLRGRIRGIEIHSESVDKAHAGTRTALNIQGIEKSEAHRGSVLIRTGELVPTYMFDATLRILPNRGRPFEQRSKALVHTGTAQILSTVVLLDRATVEPGDDALAQVRLESPVVVLPGDPFILRGFEVLANYGKTEGGGRVLDPLPKKHRTTDTDAVRTLRVLREGDASAQVEEMVRQSGAEGISRSDLRRRTTAGRDELNRHIQRLLARGGAISYEAEDTSYVHTEAYEQLVDTLVRHTRSYHDKNPARPGIPKEELRGKVRYALDPRLFGHMLDSLQTKGRVVADGESVRLKGFTPRVTGQLQQAREALLRLYESANLEPPLHADATAHVGLPDSVVREAFDVLTREGMLVRVRGDLYFARSALDRLREQLVAFLEEHGEITTPQFKDMTGCSRKFSIPLGEFFDAEKLTLRVGDNVRRLRKK